MTIDWRILIMAVPWDEVIKNAPKIADGAKKLWGSIANKPPEQKAQTEEPGESSGSQSIAKLEEQLAIMDEKVSELHGQMVASARLITELADQNARLVRHAEIQQRQILWLAGTAAVLFIISIANLF